MKAYLNTNNPKRNTLIVRGTRREMESLISLLDTSRIIDAGKNLGIDLAPFGILAIKHSNSSFCPQQRVAWLTAIT